MTVALIAAMLAGGGYLLLRDRDQHLGGKLRVVAPAQRDTLLAAGVASRQHAKREGITQLVTRTGRLPDGVRVRFEQSHTEAVTTRDAEGVEHTYAPTQDPGARLIVSVPSTRRSSVRTEASGISYLSPADAERLLNAVLAGGGVRLDERRDGTHLRSPAAVAGDVELRRSRVVVSGLFLLSDCSRLEGQPRYSLLDLRRACAG